MSDATIGTKVKEEDFYNRLISLIDSGKMDEALTLFETLERDTEKLDVLYRIARDLVRTDDLASTITSDLVSILARVSDLARELEHAHGLARNLDLTRVSDLAHDLVRALAVALNNTHYDFDSVSAIAHNLARVSDLALGHALTLDSDLDSVSVLIRDLARSRAIVHEFRRASDLSRARALARNLVHALALVRAHIKFIITVPITKIKAIDVASPRGLTLDGIDTLTPRTLTTQVAPYLEALADIQTVISRLKDEPIPEIKVSRISQNSPVSISLDGVSNAVEIVLNIIIPGRREYTKELKRLELEEKRADVLDKRASTAEKRANVLHKDEELERLRLENEALRLEISERKIRKRTAELELMNLALLIVQTYAPNLSEADQLEYANLLLGPVSEIVQSQLELRSGQDKAS